MSADSSSKASSHPDTPERLEVDRRKFIGTMGLTAGAVLSAAVAPLAARAARDEVPSSVPAEAPPSVVDGSEGLWDVDDMWGHRPRYAHAIPYAHGIPGAGPLESSGPYSVLGREL